MCGVARTLDGPTEFFLQILILGVVQDRVWVLPRLVRLPHVALLLGFPSCIVWIDILVVSHVHLIDWVVRLRIDTPVLLVDEHLEVGPW